MTNPEHLYVYMPLNKRFDLYPYLTNAYYKLFLVQSLQSACRAFKSKMPGVSTTKAFDAVAANLQAWKGTMTQFVQQMNSQ